MTDPRMPEIDDELRELIEAESRRPGLDTAARERIAAGVRARISGGGGGPDGSPGGGAPVPPTAPSGPGGGGTPLGAASWLPVGTFVAGAIVGASLYAVLGGTDARPVERMQLAETASIARGLSAPSPRRQDAPSWHRGNDAANVDPGARSPSSPRGALSPNVDTDERSQSWRPGSVSSNGERDGVRSDARAAPRTRESPRSDGADDLAHERALVERARTALIRGEPTRALDALREHQRRHPRGQLAEERDALRIEALRAAGRATEARGEAEQFRRAHPESLHAPEAE